MKKIILTLSAIVFVLTLTAQKKDPVLLTIDNKGVNLSEFEAIYKKNNNDKKNEESLNEYLDLYVKFKLKVRAAEDLGLDTTQAFIKELMGYRKQLAQPYLTDKNVTEELIKEAYERMKTDVKAKHILILSKAEDLPKDTLEAYTKIMNIRKRVLAGEDFEKVAKETSEDPSAQQNGGNLGYFSALYMVYPFENAAYTTKVGEVSMPIKTKFGYHLVKVEDKRPARGTITVAHIMVKSTKDVSPEIEATNLKKINEIYDKVLKGEKSFEELASLYSDDKASAGKGGGLAPFTAGRMVQSFEDAAFALKKDGDMSKPTKTAYGWHIIKRVSLKELGTYDELYGAIKGKVAKDSRSNKSKVAFINRLKQEYQFKENPKEKEDFYKVVGDEFLAGTWEKEKAKNLNKIMFSFYAANGDKIEFTQTDFSAYLAKKQPKGKKGVKVKTEINRLYNKVVVEKVIAFEDSRLEKKYDEFRLLMQEYRDGILLFELTDKKVWSKAVKDTLGLQEFHQTNASKYVWNERAEAIVYTCKDAETAKKVTQLIKKKTSKDDILKAINTESQLTLKVEEGKYSKGDNEVVDQAEWKKGTTSNIKYKENIVLVEVRDILAPAPKKLSEIRGLVTSDYQNHLEAEWIKELKGKYKVEIDKEVLKLVN